jgi:hypothetical protein
MDTTKWTLLLLVVVLGIVIGVFIGWNMRKPSTITNVRTETIEIPSQSSTGTSKPGKTIIKWFPFNPDSLELDSLRAIARDYILIAPPFETMRSDSMLEVYIKSYPLYRFNWDSVVVKKRSISQQDTTTFNTFKNGLSWWWLPIVIIEAIIIALR